VTSPRFPADTQLRFGHGRPSVTAPLQRDWRQRHPTIELDLIRHNSADRRRRKGHLRRRHSAPTSQTAASTPSSGQNAASSPSPSDDPHCSTRRLLTMTEVAERTVVVDPRVGTTGSDL
jgi:hypothetical protein